MTALRPGPSITRAIAIIAAAGLQFLLLGLSAAHTTLPGDFFQVARTTAAPAPNVVAQHVPDPRADEPTAPPWSISGLLAGLLAPLALVIAFASAACAAVRAAAPRSRPLAVVSGRGPPLRTAT